MKHERNLYTNPDANMAEPFLFEKHMFDTSVRGTMGKKRHPANSKLIAANKRLNKAIFPAQLYSIPAYKVKENDIKIMKNFNSPNLIPPNVNETKTLHCANTRGKTFESSLLKNNSAFIWE